MINLFRVILPVTDIEKASRFYSNVFQTPGDRVSAGRHYFECGGTILACYDPGADGDDPGQSWQLHDNQYLYFAVPDINSVRQRVIQSGGEILSDIADMPWGETLFYALDPFANRLSFVDENTLFRGEN